MFSPETTTTTSPGLVSFSSTGNLMIVALPFSEATTSYSKSSVLKLNVWQKATSIMKTLATNHTNVTNENVVFPSSWLSFRADEPEIDRDRIMIRKRRAVITCQSGDRLRRR